MSRKIYNFAIEIDGIDQLLIQEVKKPKVEFGSVAHGVENGQEEKTAGGVAVGDAELMKIKSATTGDSWAWDWMMQNLTGVPSDYKKDVVFKELASDGVTTINRWLWEGVWVKTTDDSSFKRGNQQENVIETVTLSVDKVKKLA